jgi:hypothetical protein
LSRGAQKARKRPKASAVGVRDRLLDAADRLFYREACGPWVSTASWRKPTRRRRRSISTSAARTSSWRRTSSAEQGARAHIEAYLADTPPSQRALKFFDWVVAWAESKDFRGCPLQHTVSELTDAAHPARAIAHGQREWFAERFREWTTAAGVKDPKATARALMVLFDGAVAGSEVDGPQRASDARWLANKLLAG